MEQTTHELQVKDKQELAGNTEHTKPGRVYTPDVDILETESQITLLADMPGVKPEGLNIDLRDDTLTLSGDVEPVSGDGENLIYGEYETGMYFRRFSLSEVIDQQRIDAKLKGGVLNLTLPKVEKASPRKIQVTAA